MKNTFCYWSVAATDESNSAMLRCVNSARDAGVYKSFHVFCHEPVDGCESYQMPDIERPDNLHILAFLKAAISKLRFDYYVWVSPETIFQNAPVNLLEVLQRSPIHLPLMTLEQFEKLPSSQTKLSTDIFRTLMQKGGVFNTALAASDKFWILRRSAVDMFYQIAQQGCETACKNEISITFREIAGLAMQMLCADPEAHLWNRRADLWSTPEVANHSASALSCNSF